MSGLHGTRNLTMFDHNLTPVTKAVLVAGVAASILVLGRVTLCLPNRPNPLLRRPRLLPRPRSLLRLALLQLALVRVSQGGRKCISKTSGELTRSK